MSDFKFNSAELQKIVDDASGDLFLDREKLNQISQDIKTLELFLKEKGIGSGEGSSCPTPQGELSWANQRIYIYLADTVNGYRSKPLLECDARIRVRLYRFLPRFLEIILNSYKEKLCTNQDQLS